MHITYARQDSDLFLDNDNKKYIFKIKDLLPEEKPREKLLKHGSQSLSTSELLAVFKYRNKKRRST